VENAQLIDFLKEVDKKLMRRIDLVAVGGKAMTLLILKPSTRDMNFTGPTEDIVEFEVAHKESASRFRNRLLGRRSSFHD
jgi:hypothetical protein